MNAEAAEEGGDTTVRTGLTVAVRGADVREAADETAIRAVADAVPEALAGKDATLWGEETSAEAAVRLGWLDFPTSSRELLPRLAELAETVRGAGLDHVVLAGMGGSSLAPEVIARSYGDPERPDARPALTVLDATDPHEVGRVLADRIERTAVVVSSKSGTTIETDSHRRVYEQAFRDAGLSEKEIAARFVVVTDPGSPLEELAREAGHHLVLTDPNVGGRYSALSAFGLVPPTLVGIDVQPLLDDAAAVAPSLARNEGNPGLTLGAALGGGACRGRNKIVLADTGSGIVGFGGWAEQLLAESTGKQGRGLLPVVTEGMNAPGTVPTDDTHLVALGPPAGGADTAVSGPLGAQFLVWEYATAIAGWALGINPFDQPNVTESKENTNELLEAGLPVGEPALVDGAVEVHAAPDLLRGAGTLSAALDALLAALPSDGYLAVMAYLDRARESSAADLRSKLDAQVAQPVTFGWGPRFLHSTGQYHKGGPGNGVFLQITGEVIGDIQVPGKSFTLGRLQLAQALGDLHALRRRERPALRLHLRDRDEGLRQLLRAAEGRT